MRMNDLDGLTSNLGEVPKYINVCWNMHYSDINVENEKQ